MNLFTNSNYIYDDILLGYKYTPPSWNNNEYLSNKYLIQRFADLEKCINQQYIENEYLKKQLSVTTKELEKLRADFENLKKNIQTINIEEENITVTKVDNL